MQRDLVQRAGMPGVSSRMSGSVLMTAVWEQVGVGGAAPVGVDAGGVGVGACCVPGVVGPARLRVWLPSPCGLP